MIYDNNEKLGFIKFGDLYIQADTIESVKICRFKKIVVHTKSGAVYKIKTTEDKFIEKALRIVDCKHDENLRLTLTQHNIAEE